MAGTAERDAASLQAPGEQDKACLEVFLGTFGLKTRTQVMQREEKKMKIFCLPGPFAVPLSVF